MTKAVFLDRDGVINKEKEYLYRIEDFDFIEGVFDAVSAIRQHHFLAIVITNQSGIGRGYYSQSDYSTLTDWMLNEFKVKNIQLNDVFHCPHTPSDLCNCRKPNSGMILEACQKFDIDLLKSWLIGDKEIDIETGINAGIPNNILVRSGHPIDEVHTKAAYIRDSIYDSLDLILDKGN